MAKPGQKALSADCHDRRGAVVTPYSPEITEEGLIFLINPCKTFPGPHSMNPVAPSVTIRSMD